jgi:cell wall-associated NlpC family hydrolase
MSLAAALVTTFSLPSYAVDFHSEKVSVEEFEALIAQAQKLQLAGEYASASGARDGYTTAAPIPVFVPSVSSRSSSYSSVDVSTISTNSVFLQTALSLVGMPGDCTAFVEQTLRNMGHRVGDIGTMSFGAYGTVFSDPSQVQPGDIMMRPSHVAIYAGNGLVAHGGIGGMSILHHRQSNPAEYELYVRVH